MLKKFSVLPINIPTLKPTMSAALRGPRYILECVPDVGGTVAAWVCRSLWEHYGRDGSSLQVPLQAVLSLHPLGPEYYTLTRVNRQEAQEADGCGYLLFDDLSVLLFQRSDQAPWRDENLTEDNITILPVIFRIPSIIETSEGGLLIQTQHCKSDVVLQPTITSPVKTPSAMEALRHQIARETAAWGAWITRMPNIAPPSSKKPGCDWPSFFPLRVEPSPELRAFENHVLEVVRSVMAWAPDSLSFAQVSVRSSRPLQNGIEPMQLTLNWKISQSGRPYLTDSLNTHVHNLVFGKDTPWSMDDFPGCEIFFDIPEMSYAANIELFTHALPSNISNHERLRLISLYPAPPSPPPLPGEAGYGRPNRKNPPCP